MKRLGLLLAALGIAVAPALATSYYFCPDVPTDLAAATYTPWDVVRNNSGSYVVAWTLPAPTTVDAFHRMCSGNGLLSVEAASELPPGSGAWFERRDVLEYDPALGIYSPFFCGRPVGIPAGSDVDAAFLDGDDTADLILGFDVHTDLTAIGGGVYAPADLVRFRRVGAGCAGWILTGLYFDASSTSPPMPASTDVTGADRRGPLTVLTLDVPTTLGPPTHIPGEFVSWNGTSYATYHLDASWPIHARANAFAFLADPGTVVSLTVDKSAIIPGNLTIAWTASTSAGAEDYAIYEGSIGSWYSHARIDCHDNAGDLTEQVAPSAGDRYYLVVPLNAEDEGSYGKDSAGVERLQGTSPCRPTQGLDCP